MKEEMRNVESRKTRCPRRYAVIRAGDHSVELRVLADCGLGSAGQVREFFVPAEGGYVREWVGGDARQVCDGLSSRGPTLRSAGPRLASDIRREAAALLRLEAKKLTWF